MGSARKERDDTTLRVLITSRDKFMDWLDRHYLRSADAGLNILVDFAEENALSFATYLGNSTLKTRKEEVVGNGVHSS